MTGSQVTLLIGLVIIAFLNNLQLGRVELNTRNIIKTLKAIEEKLDKLNVSTEEQVHDG